MDQNKKKARVLRYSKPWSIKIRVWGAGDNAENDSVKQVVIQRAQWVAGKASLAVAGTLKFNRLLPPAEKKAWAESNSVAILSVSGQSELIRTQPNASGNWSALVPLGEAQVPCQVVAKADGHSAHRDVKLAPPNCMSR